MKCRNCEKPLTQPKRGRKRIWCSDKCKANLRLINFHKTRPTQVKRNCKNCGKEFIKDRQSQKRYCSKSCFPSVTNPRQKFCIKCKIPVIGKRRRYCDPCVQIILAEVAEANRVHRPEEAESTRKGKRHARERNAIGLNQHERKRLLKLWQSQQRECSYCFNLADTIDHLVPLFRGGTNEITNLVPSCRSCNSSKGSKLISEWKPNARTSTKTNRVKAVAG